MNVLRHASPWSHARPRPPPASSLHRCPQRHSLRQPLGSHAHRPPARRFVHTSLHAPGRAPWYRTPTPWHPSAHARVTPSPPPQTLFTPAGPGGGLHGHGPRSPARHAGGAGEAACGDGPVAAPAPHALGEPHLMASWGRESAGAGVRCAQEWAATEGVHAADALLSLVDRLTLLVAQAAGLGHPSPTCRPDHSCLRLVLHAQAFQRDPRSPLAPTAPRGSLHLPARARLSQPGVDQCTGGGGREGGVQERYSTGQVAGGEEAAPMPRRQTRPPPQPTRPARGRGDRVLGVGLE